MKKANSYQHVLFGLCQRTVQLYFVENMFNSFPTIPARQWGHCFGTVRPVGLAIWRDLSHLFRSSLRWSFKGCGNSSNRGRSGRTTCRALGSALVLSCWWVGESPFFSPSVTKDEGHDTKVYWTWFQSSMDKWTFDVVLGSQQQMPFLHPFAETKLRRFFSKKSPTFDGWKQFSGNQRLEIHGSIWSNYLQRPFLWLKRSTWRTVLWLSQLQHAKL